MKTKQPKFEYGRPFPDKGMGVTVTDGSPFVCMALQHAMRDNWTASPTYQLRQPSGAFLQGYEPVDGWVFIEFWSEPEKHMPFVLYLLQLFREHHGKGQVVGMPSRNLDANRRPKIEPDNITPIVEALRDGFMIQSVTRDIYDGHDKDGWAKYKKDSRYFIDLDGSGRLNVTQDEMVFLLSSRICTSKFTYELGEGRPVVQYLKAPMANAWHNMDALDRKWFIREWRTRNDK